MAEAIVNEKPDHLFSERIGIYRRKFHQAIEQVIIDERDQTVDFSESFFTLLAIGSSKYEKAIAALRIISCLTPQAPMGIFRKRYTYKQDLMSLSPEDYTLRDKIGSGGVSDVFLLESNKKGAPSYVLKINLGRGARSEVENLLSIAKEQKEEYDKISAAYKDIPGLIQKEYYLIMHGPRMGTPAVAIIQPFIGENIRDFFADFEEDELLDLLQTNKPLANQVVKFVETTRADGSLIESELDLLGMNNLAIVGKKGSERLLFLDPHFRSSATRNAEMKERIEKRMNYIEELARASS